MPAHAKCILTINSGSSSMKFAVFRSDPDMRQIWAGDIDRIGQSSSEMHIRDAAGTRQASQSVAVASHEDAPTCCSMRFTLTLKQPQ